MPDQTLSERLKAAIDRRSPDTLNPRVIALWARVARWKKRQAEAMRPSEAVWCLVANVAEFQPYGEDHEIRRGTKHFSPNTKVYCYPGLWGDGYENIKVIGRHRGSRRLATLVMPRRRLTNWRVKLVRQPYVVATMFPTWTEESAQAMAAICRFDEAASNAKRAGFESISPDEALLYATRFGLIEEMDRALARGADIHSRMGQFSVLYLAIAHGGAEVVRFLVSRGANVLAPCGEFESAVAMARVYGPYSPGVLSALGATETEKPPRTGRWRRIWKAVIRLVTPPNGQVEPGDRD